MEGGLNYLHNYTDPPYLDKNLKSSNILLNACFRAKLSNFGLALAITDDDDRGGQAVGGGGDDAHAEVLHPP